MEKVKDSRADKVADDETAGTVDGVSGVEGVEESSGGRRSEGVAKQGELETNGADVSRLRVMRPGVVVYVPRVGGYVVVLSHSTDGAVVVVALNDAGGKRRGGRFAVDADEVGVEVPVDLLGQIPTLRRGSELGQYFRTNKSKEVESVLLRLPRGTMGMVELVCRAIDAAGDRDEGVRAKAEVREVKELERANPVDLVYAMICEGLGRAMERLREAGMLGYRMTGKGLRVGLVMKGGPSPEAEESLAGNLSVEDEVVEDAEAAIRAVATKLNENTGPLRTPEGGGEEN